MGRRAYKFSARARREMFRYAVDGERTHRRAGEPATPSLRDVARHLYAQKLTFERVDPAVIRRALKRGGQR